MKDQETFAFQLETRSLINLIIEKFYSKKETFLFELISNALDALERVRYETDFPTTTTANPNLELCVNLTADSVNRTITITDAGIGMTKMDLVKNLGSIGKSGTKEFASASLKGNSTDISLIGQFGFGFFSAFAVAEEVTVITKNNNDRCYRWVTCGDGNYTIREHNSFDLQRGTIVQLRIKQDQLELLDQSIIRTVIRKHFQSTRYPIHLNNFFSKAWCQVFLVLLFTYLSGWVPMEKFWNYILYQLEFQHFGDQNVICLDNDTVDDDDENIFSAPTLNPLNPHAGIDLDEEVKRIKKRIFDVKRKAKIQEKSMISIDNIKAGRYGVFFNTVCQVIGILRSTEGMPRVYLRVTDGTMLTMTKPLCLLSDDRRDFEKCEFLDEPLYEAIRCYAVDIVCFDEYAEKAEECQPGDIIELKNVRAHELDSTVSLKLNGNGGRYGRSLKILERNNSLLSTQRSTQSQQFFHTPTQRRASPPFVSLENNIDEEDEDVKLFPVPESIMGSPLPKRSRIDEDSLVAESPLR